MSPSFQKPVAPWKGLNEDNWAEPDNLRLLARQIVMGGNLVIRLGSDSDNLVSVDLDRNDWIEPFLKANPAFRNTLRTFGSKGGQFWLKARSGLVVTSPDALRRKEDMIVNLTDVLPAQRHTGLAKELELLDIA